MQWSAGCSRPKQTITECFALMGHEEKSTVVGLRDNWIWQMTTRGNNTSICSLRPSSSSKLPEWGSSQWQTQSSSPLSRLETFISSLAWPTHRWRWVLFCAFLYKNQFNMLRGLRKLITCFWMDHANQYGVHIFAWYREWGVSPSKDTNCS